MNNKKYLFWLLGIDLTLLLLYRHYQPLCEPCLNKQNCPPCISENQYFILYFGIAFNLFIGMYFLYKNRMKKKR